MSNMISHIMVKESKVKVKYSKMVIFTSSIGSSNQLVFKFGRDIYVPEGSSQTKVKGSKVKVKYSKNYNFHL